MNFKPLDVYEPLYFTPPNVRYISACGGRGGGRSHNCSEHFIFKITRPEYFRGLIARAVYTDLEKTTWIDFLDRIDATEGLNPNDFKINESKKVITYIPTGNTITGIGFRKTSGNRKASLKGFANVTDVLIEEAQELEEPELNQLDDTLRTILGQIRIIFAYNMPSASHVLMRRFFDLEPVILIDGNGVKWSDFSKAVPKKTRPDHIFIFSDYLDNYDNLNKGTIANYERYFYDNPEHFFNEIKGYVYGGAKGLIFKYGTNWKKWSKLPEDLEFYETFGLDYGGGGADTDEPDGSSKTVFGKLWINKDLMRIYVKILVYKGYISSSELTETCKTETLSDDFQHTILADNARKDKITEMLNDGLNVIGAKTKEGGSSSVVSGYEMLKRYTLYIHEDDINAQTELNNHRWAMNKATGITTGQPEDKFKDVLDMIRYAAVHYHLFGW